MSDICEFCGSPKKKISKDDYLTILRELNKTWEELSPMTRQLFKLSKHGYTCKCPDKHSLWEFEKARNKQC